MCERVTPAHGILKRGICWADLCRRRELFEQLLPILAK